MLLCCALHSKRCSVLALLQAAASQHITIVWCNSFSRCIIMVHTMPVSIPVYSPRYHPVTIYCQISTCSSGLQNITMSLCIITNYHMSRCLIRYSIIVYYHILHVPVYQQISPCHVYQQISPCHGISTRYYHVQEWTKFQFIGFCWKIVDQNY